MTTLLTVAGNAMDLDQCVDFRVDELHDRGVRMQEIAQQIDELRIVLARSSDEDGTWAGKAITKLKLDFDATTRDLGKAAITYRLAGQMLERYALDLDGVQGIMLGATSDAAESWQTLLSEVETYEQLLGFNAIFVVPALPSPHDVGGGYGPFVAPDPRDLPENASFYDELTPDARGIFDLVSEAWMRAYFAVLGIRWSMDRFDGAHADWLEAYERALGVTVGVQEQGLRDDFWDQISDPLDDVAMVAGGIADAMDVASLIPPVGAVLAPFSLVIGTVASVSSIADTWIDYFRGEGRGDGLGDALVDTLWDVVSVLPFVPRVADPLTRGLSGVARNGSMVAVNATSGDYWTDAVGRGQQVDTWRDELEAAGVDV